METLITLAPLLLIIVVMYLFLIRPQKKKEKQIQAMRSSIQVGDKVITIGGFRGTIVKTKDDVLTVQLGSEKMKVEIMRWGISKVDEEAPGSRVQEQEEEVEEAPKKTLPKKMKPKVKEESGELVDEEGVAPQESEEDAK